jgi:hypothetical protein
MTFTLSSYVQIKVLCDLQVDNRMRLFAPQHHVESGLIYTCEQGKVDFDKPCAWLPPTAPFATQRITENMPAGSLLQVQSPVKALTNIPYWSP